MALGVVFDISKLEHGLSQVKHKPKRSSEVKEQLYNVLSEGSFSATLAASLRGKLQLMESAACGNAARGTFEFSNMRIQSPTSFLTERTVKPYIGF